jgi:hypothetical protein
VLVRLSWLDPIFVPVLRRAAAPKSSPLVGEIVRFTGHERAAFPNQPPFQQRWSEAAGGDLAACLAHRHTTATLRDLSARIIETITKTENWG